MPLQSYIIPFIQTQNRSHGMRTTRWVPVIILFLVVAAGVIPVMAFQAEYLGITVLENGDAQVEFTYSLTWYEYVFVFLQIVSPAAELEKALEDYSGKDVRILGVTGNSASLLILDFAAVQREDAQTTYRTPELYFQDARTVAQKYWWANIVTVDFRPVMTVMKFPDGHEEQFASATTVPHIVWTVH